MKEIIETLMPIKNSTGLEIDLYTYAGQLLFSTGGDVVDYKFKFHKKEEFDDAIISDKNDDVTYFMINSAPQNYVGVIVGSNDVSRNYAVMVTSLIKKAIDTEKVAFDDATRFKLLFNGEISDSQLSQLKSNYKSKKSEYYVICIALENEVKKLELYNLLQTLSANGDFIIDLSDCMLVYLKKSDLIGEYSSANDFAKVLTNNIQEEMKIQMKIGVGGETKNFGDILTAFKNSLLAYNLGSVFSPQINIYSYKEYVIMKLLSELSKEDLTKSLNSILEGASISILSDNELIQTAEIFMDNSLNISQACKKMFMHRNTLIYKLDKIENETGLNIRNFDDAVVLKVIIALYKLKNQK